MHSIPAGSLVSRFDRLLQGRAPHAACVNVLEAQS